MLKIKRILALLLAALMLLVCLPSCGKSKEEKQMQTVVGTCAGYDVLYEELRYITLTYKDLFASTYGATIWDTPESAEQYRAELEETVFRIMLSNYAVLATCKNYMPKESIEDKSLDKSVDEYIEEIIENYGGKKEFQAALKESHMTENLARFTYRVALLENELLYVLTDDLSRIENDPTRFAAWLKDGNCVYVQHIFVSKETEGAKEKIDDVRAQILSGSADIEDFVGKAINEDLENVNPYFVVRDVYTQAIESAVFALDEVGSVSQAVDTGDGYYLFQRLPYEEAQLTSRTDDLLYSYQWAHVEKIVEAQKETLTIEWNDYGKSIDLLTIQ